MLQFTIRCQDTSPGDEVWLVRAEGSSATWPPADGYQLMTVPRKFPLWQSEEIDVPFSIYSFQYLYQIRRKDHQGTENSSVRYTWRPRGPWWTSSSGKRYSIVVQDDGDFYQHGVPAGTPAAPVEAPAEPDSMEAVKCGLQDFVVNQVEVRLAQRVEDAVHRSLEERMSELKDRATTASLVQQSDGGCGSIVAVPQGSSSWSWLASVVARVMGDSRSETVETLQKDVARLSTQLVRVTADLKEHTRVAIQSRADFETQLAAEKERVDKLQIDSSSATKDLESGASNLKWDIQDLKTRFSGLRKEEGSRSERLERLEQELQRLQADMRQSSQTRSTMASDSPTSASRGLGVQLGADVQERPREVAANPELASEPESLEASMPDEAEQATNEGDGRLHSGVAEPPNEDQREAPPAAPGTKETSPGAGAHTGKGAGSPTGEAEPPPSVNPPPLRHDGGRQERPLPQGRTSASGPSTWSSFSSGQDSSRSRSPAGLTKATYVPLQQHPDDPAVRTITRDVEFRLLSMLGASDEEKKDLLRQINFEVHPDKKPVEQRPVYDEAFKWFQQWLHEHKTFFWSPVPAGPGPAARAVGRERPDAAGRGAASSSETV